MKRKSLLIVGCGDLGSRVGSALLAEGWTVHGARRNSETLPSGFVAHRANYAAAGGLESLSELRPHTVLATFVPVDRTVEGYVAGFVTGARNLVATLGDHRPERLLFVSSTRVFAESGGGWVDETSPLSGDDERAASIVEAETVVRSAGYPVSIVRFAGIYGHSGGGLLARVGRGELSLTRPRWSNRIHREDCAGFLCHLLRAAVAGEALAPVYIGVDDCPALQHEVELWLARQLDVEVGGEGSAPVAGAAVGKRCRNGLLRASGYTLRFPDYRSGYRAVLSQSLS